MESITYTIQFDILEMIILYFVCYFGCKKYITNLVGRNKLDSDTCEVEKEIKVVE